jgi:hypothetical protein
MSYPCLRSTRSHQGCDPQAINHACEELRQDSHVWGQERPPSQGLDWKVTGNRDGGTCRAGSRGLGAWRLSPVPSRSRCQCPKKPFH